MDGGETTEVPVSQCTPHQQKHHLLPLTDKAHPPSHLCSQRGHQGERQPTPCIKQQTGNMDFMTVRTRAVRNAGKRSISRSALQPPNPSLPLWHRAAELCTKYIGQDTM
uniref:Uncharacterized protein n=1 Tax=Knipowitschia caucasica TaxID=637954 RepID=A0AAV2JB39_KNICA